MDQANDQNPYQSPQYLWDSDSPKSSRPASPSFRREKRRLLVLIMPVYLLSTRGVRGLLSITKALVFFVILIAAAVLIEIAVASVAFP
jgi:hypothetical protein